MIQRPICMHEPVLVPFAKCHWLRDVASTICSAVPTEHASACIADLGWTCDLKVPSWYLPTPAPGPTPPTPPAEGAPTPAVIVPELAAVPVFPSNVHACGRASAAAWA